MSDAIEAEREMAVQLRAVYMNAPRTSDLPDDGERWMCVARAALALPRAAMPPAPAEPKCPECGSPKAGRRYWQDRALGRAWLDYQPVGASLCLDPFHATPPRPVTTGDRAGGEREAFIAWWGGDSSTDYAAFPGENTKCVAYAAWCGRARALRDEREGEGGA